MLDAASRRDHQAGPGQQDDRDSRKHLGFNIADRVKAAPQQRFPGGGHDAGDVGAVVGDLHGTPSETVLKVNPPISKQQRRHDDCRDKPADRNGGQLSWVEPSDAEPREPEHDEQREEEHVVTGRERLQQPRAGKQNGERRPPVLQIQMQRAERNRHPVRREQLQMIQMRESIGRKRERDGGDERRVASRRESQTEEVGAQPRTARS